MNNNKNMQQTPGNVPIIRPTVDVNCWCCNRQMKVPEDVVKKVLRIVCPQCGADFDTFLWTLFKQAKLSREALKKSQEMAKNN